MLEKVIKYLKHLYLVVVVLFALFASGLFIAYRNEIENITITQLISASILIVLIWMAITSLFIFASGVLKRYSYKQDLNKRNAARRQIIGSILLLFILAAIWFSLQLIENYFYITL